MLKLWDLVVVGRGGLERGGTLWNNAAGFMTGLVRPSPALI